MMKLARRYLSAFLAANIGAVAGGLLAHFLFGNVVVTVFAATWGENIGYYGQIFWSDIKERKRREGALTSSDIYKVMRNMTIEFGPAEVLDSFVVRPVFIFVALHYIENTALGIFVGRSVADVFFHATAGVMYTIRKKYLRD